MAISILAVLVLAAVGVRSHVPLLPKLFVPNSRQSGSRPTRRRAR